MILLLLHDPIVYFFMILYLIVHDTIVHDTILTPIYFIVTFHVGLTHQLSRQLIPDIPALVSAAREGRVNMVQTADQYEFVFRVVRGMVDAHAQAPDAELSRV